MVRTPRDAMAAAIQDPNFPNPTTDTAVCTEPPSADSNLHVSGSLSSGGAFSSRLTVSGTSHPATFLGWGWACNSQVAIDLFGKVSVDAQMPSHAFLKPAKRGL